jgi:hypothetical protein
VTNERYRAGAARLYAREGVTVERLGRVSPMASGGAFVELTCWVPEAEAHE